MPLELTFLSEQTIKAEMEEAGVGMDIFWKVNTFYFWKQLFLKPISLKPCSVVLISGMARL